ncbi:T9SS type A sorting domain-containing protein [Dyadobacter sandarakinus]|uniref:T9SS type A sorting domain-containing protein n=1 Tax=Dyadobacter sandarakinus TaxID=2747268 RepID=A0ABX7I6D8_9BACT|nr:T9SS type A sorting domain-containing protein [Dyadobacter sandarakinus]QRR00753.1 T9SS type A sorting domain-containing protein [Dyadobacter sandarakinus]
MDLFYKVLGNFLLRKINKSAVRQICLAAFCFLPQCLSAAVIYVNPAAGGNGSGSSWGNAYTKLAPALAAAVAGDEIWVKKGVYKPSIAFDINGNGTLEAQEVTFRIRSGIAVYGGFAGNETLRSQRNYLANLTILSGDIDNNDSNVDGNNIAENTGNIQGANAFHVVYTRNVDAAARLDGFIVTAGRAKSSGVSTDANQDGGGWYNHLGSPANASSPTIANTTFRGNYAESEGGALFSTALAGGTVASVISNCKFISNKSNVAGGAVNMGSFSAGNYQPQFRKCEFVQNEAYRRGGAIYLIGDHAVLDSTTFRANMVTAVSPDKSTLPGSGGGVGMVGSNARFSNCIFDSNTTTGNPTGPFEGGGGGAVYMSVNESQSNTLGISEPKFVNCGFYNNVASGNVSAWGGAAVHLSDGGKLRPTYTGCVFTNNQAQNLGGAVANFARVISVATGFVPELTPVFTNCTFYYNQAGQQGGAIYNQGYIYKGAQVLNAKVENAILWNDMASTSGPEVGSSTARITIYYSLVKGSGGSGAGWNGSLALDGGNNIDTNPGFVNTADADGADNLPGTSDDGLRTTAYAPVTDVGNNAAAGLAGVTKDFIGGARIQGSTVDMGAYETARIKLPDLGKLRLYDWRPVVTGCLSCPWAIQLNERIFQNFSWDGAAYLTDGRSTFITGKIVSRENREVGFEVYLRLVSKQDWSTWSARGRTYSTYASEAEIAARRNHINWTFWELSSDSYLKGTGLLSGTLSLAHTPVDRHTGFQLGVGANGWDADQGLSGTFSYRGTLLYRGERLALNNVGSLNVDARQSDRAVRLMVPEPEVAAGDAVVSKPALSIYPNPARDAINLQSENLIGKFGIKLLRQDGSVVSQWQGASTDGTVRMPVKGVKPGNYLLILTGKDGTVTSGNVLVE